MKMLAGLLIGAVLGIVATVFIIQGTIPARAGDAVSQDPVTAGEAAGEEAAAWLPDVGKMYRKAFGKPFRAVQKEIYDPEIANFYHELMQETGLDLVGVEE